MAKISVGKACGNNWHPSMLSEIIFIIIKEEKRTAGFFGEKVMK